jgi:hypothetical protein
MKEGKLDPWYEGQVELIKDIQTKLTKILEESKGVDLLLDTINLLKEIRPIKKEEDE